MGDAINTVNEYEGNMSNSFEQKTPDMKKTKSSIVGKMKGFFSYKPKQPKEGSQPNSQLNSTEGADQRNSTN